ncbi:MAG: aminodeoxychorismate synthase component I, partial [Sphingopyxis sp.]
MTLPPRRLTADAPFILLDDARSADGAHHPVPARLLTNPVEIITAHTPQQLRDAITTLGQWQQCGAHAGGFISYDAGHALEPRLAATMRAPLGGWPLAWFARFAQCERIGADALAAMLPDGAGAALGQPQPGIDFATYHQRISTVLDHIHAGNIYQANLTFPADVAVHGHPLAAYARLRGHARAGYGGVVFTGQQWLLSLSPELFVSIKDGSIMARPMKGTARRHANPLADAQAAADLARDPKQRAENLMIVDLLRNDLSRVAVAGSVHVPALFRVETYPTIHQMVSDVRAEIAPGTGIDQILATIFPCGSITGAPKIRAMDVIASVETQPRGPYTGAIGFIAPDGECAFNVAIRTLALPHHPPATPRGDGQDDARNGGDAGVARGGESTKMGAAPLRHPPTCATLGLGSGIVADSQPMAEWQECLAKGEFIRVAGADFDLLETMAFDPLDGVLRLDAHLARLGDSARTFGFGFDRHAIRNMLQHATFRQREPARLRLRLSRAGHVAIAMDAPPPPPATPVRVAFHPLPVDPADIRLRHKTADRHFYDDARAAS